MALRTDYEQTACRLDFLSLAGNLRLKLIFQFVVLGSALKNLFVICLGKTGALADNLVLIAEFFHLPARKVVRITAEHDICASARHVGGYGYGAFFTCLSYYLRLFFVVLGIEHLMFNAAAFEHCADELGFIYGDRAHKHRLPLCVARLYLRHNGAQLACLGLVHGVGVVYSYHRLVGRYGNAVEFVYLLKFLLLCKRSTGHTGEFVIQSEKVLECDCGKGLALACNLHSLFCLYCLVQTLIVAATDHETPRKLVHYDNFAVFYDIIFVAFHNSVSLDCLVDVVSNRHVFRVIKVLQVKGLLGFLYAGGG